MKTASKELATTISKAIDEIRRGTKRKDVTTRKLNRVCNKYDLTPSWIALIMGITPTK